MEKLLKSITSSNFHNFKIIIGLTHILDGINVYYGPLLLKRTIKTHQINKKI